MSYIVQICVAMGGNRRPADHRVCVIAVVSEISHQFFKLGVKNAEC